MVALLAVLVLAACGGTQSPADIGDTAGGGGETADAARIVLSDFAIDAPATIEAGTTLAVVNEGDVTHNLTATEAGFATEDLEPGGEAEVTIDEPGTYDVVCTIHRSQMTGTIEATG